MYYMAIFGKKTEDKNETADKEKAKSMKELYSETKTAEKDGKKATGRAYGYAYKVLVKPLITEKAGNLGALNKYVFAVSMGANKIEAAKAVKEIYGVKPVSVNFIKMTGKKARYGRTSGKRKDWKKAVITLPAGQSIKVYEGV